MKVRGAPVLENRMRVTAMTSLQGVLDASSGPKRALRHLSLPLPKKPSEEALRFPSSIDELSHGQIRNLMFYYTAWYGYANTQLGIWRAKQTLLTRQLRNRREILFQKYKPEKKTSDWSEAIQGRISRNKVIRKLEGLVAEADAMVSVLDPLVWTYMKFSDVLSREITARGDEMELGGRSGQRIRSQARTR